MDAVHPLSKCLIKQDCFWVEHLTEASVSWWMMLKPLITLSVGVTWLLIPFQSFSSSFFRDAFKFFICCLQQFAELSPCKSLISLQNVARVCALSPPLAGCTAVMVHFGAAQVSP